MTTLVAIKKENRIILAADSRTTSDRYIFNVSADKITNMGTWAIALSGLGVYKEVIRANKDYILQAYATVSRDNILELCGALQALFSKYDIERLKRDDGSLHHDFSGIIINDKGGMFYISGNPSMVQHKQFLTTGSGASYAEGAMAILYPKKVSLEAMAKKAIEAAAMFDGSTDEYCQHVIYEIQNED